MSKTVSVLVLTKNRAHFLEKCLASLVSQSVVPDEVIVIDNDSEDNTQQVIKKYTSQLPLKSYTTNLKGYPSLYNFAFHKSTQSTVAFLDDDCIADPAWVKGILSGAKQHPQAVLQGITLSMPQHNIYASIMGDHYQNWIKANLDQRTGEMKVLDNKNCAFPREIFNNNNLFDETLKMGSEDIELGKRLRDSGVSIYLIPEMKAHHHERDTFRGFIQQHWRIAQSEKFLDTRLDKSKKIGGFLTKKTYLNIVSFLKRQLLYLFKFKFVKMIYVAVLYLLLAIIRLVGYFLA